MTDPLGVSAALAAALILGLPFVQASTPRPAEERDLVDFVDAHTRDALALLERVVNINSGTQNFDGVREVGRVFTRGARRARASRRAGSTARRSSAPGISSPSIPAPDRASC